MQILLTERQNREKTLPRRKREKKPKILKTNVTAVNAADRSESDDEDDAEPDADDDDAQNIMDGQLIAADAETKEAVLVRRCGWNTVCG